VLAISLFARQKGKSKMSSSSRSLLAGAILFVASLTAAEAADLGGNRDLSYAPMPAAFAPSPTWYLRGDVGYAWMDASDLAANSFTFSSVSIDNTWGLGVGIGTYFGAGVRGDLTYERLASTDVTAAAGPLPISNSTRRSCSPTSTTTSIRRPASPLTSALASAQPSTRPAAAPLRTPVAAPVTSTARANGPRRPR
jgi:opacity protein-like surface antigen